MNDITLFFWFLIGGAYSIIVILLWAIYSAQEKRSLWSEHPFVVTAYDDKGNRLNFNSDFYVNQINPESNDISFTVIRKDGRAQTLVDLDYLAHDATITPGSDSRKDLIGLSIDDIKPLLDQSKAKIAILYFKQNRLVEFYLVDKIKIQTLNKERRRVFANLRKDIIDSKGFDLFVYKSGKIKSYLMEDF